MVSFHSNEDLTKTEVSRKIYKIYKTSTRKWYIYIWNLNTQDQASKKVK